MPTRKHARSDSSTTTTDLSSLSPEVLQTLSKTRITGFTSSKLTYLISQLLLHSPTSKSIIFYDTNAPNIAFWLAEALELLSIPHRIYASSLRQDIRSEYLRSFSTDPRVRVLIMDLKQASLGLHIAVANRVYIISPIWSPSVEAQAIKRAHRIGQDKEVWVETLVLQGTIEERMWRRRKEGLGFGGSKGEEGKGWLDDLGVVGIIKAEGFLELDDAEDEDDTNCEGMVESKGKEKGRVNECAKVVRLDEPQPLFFRSNRNGHDALEFVGTEGINGKSSDEANATQKSKKRRVGGVHFDDDNNTDNNEGTLSASPIPSSSSSHIQVIVPYRPPSTIAAVK